MKVMVVVFTHYARSYE